MFLCVCVLSLRVRIHSSRTPPPNRLLLLTHTTTKKTHTTNKKNRPLIWVECRVERPSRSRTDYIVKARSQFKERSAATNVEIFLPLPADATAPTARCSQGSATYAPEKSALVWNIKSFPGGKELSLRAHFNLPSVAAEEAAHGKMPPIKVKFEIPYFTVSGVQVRCFVCCVLFVVGRAAPARRGGGACGCAGDFSS